MKLSSEAKIGLIGIATLAILIWGINYLKGRNILNGNYTLHAYFADAGGMEESSSLFMQGIKVGYIDNIELQQELTRPVHVTMHVEKKYPVTAGAIAVLYSTDVLGTRAVRIESSPSGTYLEHGDTLNSAIEADIFTSIGTQVMPVMEQVGSLAESLDSIVQKLDDLLESETTTGTLEDLRNISASLSSSLNQGGALYNSFHNLEAFSSMLESQEDEFISMATHLTSISETLDSAGIDRISMELQAAAEAFNQLMVQLNSGQGSMGKLFYSDTLYVQLQDLVVSLDSLVTDLSENPQDYVRFSLFGK
jgi:phospholipid/cholesterol/gamma-HCH transport system substrate-binding protein